MVPQVFQDMWAYVVASRGIFLKGKRVLALAFLSSLALTVPADAKPQRVVSLDYCADQFLLGLGDRDQIAAVSKDATSERSYLAAEVGDLPRIGANTEDILVLKPDLVLRVWGGGIDLEKTLARFDVPVVTIPFTQTMDDLKDSIRMAGRVLGHPDRAAQIIHRMDQRLAAVRDHWHAVPAADRPAALYVTPGGATSGQGTLMDELISASGLRNVLHEAGYTGWRDIDLEQLLLSPPDAIVYGFPDLSYNATSHWRLGRHQALKDMVEKIPTRDVESRVIACSSWFFVDAVEDIFETLVKPQLSAKGYLR